MMRMTGWRAAARRAALAGMCVAGAIAAGAPAAFADDSAFSTGPLLEGLGPNAPVPDATPIPAGARLRVAFDTRTPSSDGGEADGSSLNRTLVSAARFLNMHARAGVDPENLAVAVVIHSKAVFDVSEGEAGERNRALVEALLAHNGRIIICGQTAAHYDVSAADLLPGVEMALSAMTAHALLQQDGYTLNPF